MEHFDTSSTNDSDYQCVVCHLSCGIVCYIYLNPKIKRDKLGDIMKMLTHYSQKENFLGVIGDLNIRSEFGIDTSTKLMDIFQKLGVKSVFKSVTHNLDGQLDYVLMRNDIQSNKYLAGTFKNLYSDHSSLFLRIALPEGEEEDHQEERQREREREEEQDQQVEIQYDEDEV